MAYIKYIFTLLIILLSLSMSAQNYIKILPQAGLTSEQRAIAITRELFRIQRPIDQQNDATLYLFGWIKHPTKDPNYIDTVNAALQIDTNHIIYVHPDNDLTNLIALFPELSQAEKDGLAAFIESQQSFEFRYIVPGGVTIYTKQQMEENGWFPKIEEL
jgi:hypothetical protein